MEVLTDLGRRVLGSLPPWFPDDHMRKLIAAEQDAAGEAVQSHTLDELAADLASNPAAQHLGAEGPLTREEVHGALVALEEAGYVEFIESGTRLGVEHKQAWKMTKAGREAINAPLPGRPVEPQGAVTIPMHVGSMNSGAEA